MTKKSTLYKKALKEFTKPSNQPTTYICVAIERLAVYHNHSFEEVDSLKADFIANQPSETQHKKFYFGEQANHFAPWWDREDRDIRIKFLKHLIKMHKEREGVPLLKRLYTQLINLFK